MDIENQIIKIKVINFTEKHFQNLGYNVKNGDYIEIPAKHLPNGSGTKVKVQCSYCGKYFYKAWRRYLETKDSICCESCKERKMMDTSFAKYGNICSLRNPVVQEKSQATCIKNWGVPHSLMNAEVRAKCIKTRRNNFNSNDWILKGSKQQQKFYDLYGGIYNYTILDYYVDIYFPNYNIYFEYDGSGHNLSVKLNNITQEEFDEKEFIRTSRLLSLGLKEFRIISKYDLLPNDNELFSIKNRAFYILNELDYDIYIYDLDINTEYFY